MERAPHGYHDVDRIRCRPEGRRICAGVDRYRGRSQPAATPRDAAIAYCQGNPWRNEIEARDPGGLERATQHVAEVLARRFGDGPIEGRIRALVVTAIR